jgi:hypothetical protein
MHNSMGAFGLQASAFEVKKYFDGW